MNLLTKTKSWLVASIVTAASTFAQNSKCAPSQKSFEQGHEMMQNQMMAGYNAPSRIDVRGSWDIFASASFTYWQAIQDNMELGVVADVVNPEFPSNGNIDGSVVNLNFNYKPGFKVALGMNFDHDNWDSLIEYTWFRGSHKTHTSLDRATAPSTVLFPLVGHPSLSAYYSGSQKWKIHMDLLDWELARSYYVGTKLSFRPFFAARAAWIRQKLHAEYSPSSGGTLLSMNVTDQSHSWAVGPRTGVYTNWMLGEGFRLYGNGAGDILFTQYTKLKSSQVQAIEASANLLRKVAQRNLNCLRTHLDLELGFGWASYFDNNNWHVDLTAGYGFQVFFDQNMFRHFDDSQSLVSGVSPNGNLYIHGLTASARFDF